MIQEKLVLDGYDQHFVLFAKGHYGGRGWSAGEKDMMEKLRVIVGHVSAMDEKYVTMSDVYELVSGTFIKLCVTRRPNRIKPFLRNIFSRANNATHLLYLHKSAAITPVDVIREMLEEIAVLRISDDDFVLDMGAPDPKLAELLFMRTPRVR